MTNLNLHRRSIDLEAVLQKAETLLRERAQQIRELEEVSKIPVLSDEQLEIEHKLVMEASSNIVSLDVEDCTVDQTLTFYFNALISSSYNIPPI